jgi:hypothetical protein
MTKTKSNVYHSLNRVLGAELDSYLMGNGFCRERDSLEYVRSCGAGEQILEMDLVIEPHTDLRANAQIYPWLQLRFPEVNRIALEMVAGDAWLIGGHANITLRQPLDFVIPKNAHVNWYIYSQEEDYILCARSMQGYIEKWILPFLNEYATVDSLANYYMAKDERIPAQRHFYVYVAAAFVLLKQPIRAMEVLESKFGKAAPRRDYASAFAYVAKLT